MIILRTSAQDRSMHLNNCRFNDKNPNISTPLIHLMPHNISRQYYSAISQHNLQYEFSCHCAQFPSRLQRKPLDYTDIIMVNFPRSSVLTHVESTLI